MRRLRYILYIFIIQYCAVLAQDNSSLQYIQYTTDDGLPSPEVYCAFQDSDGFMWFGTDNGVSKFDGYRFQNFGPKEGLMQNVVFNIHEDKFGRIWFGSMTGEAFIMENDTIYAWEYNDKVLEYKEYFSHAHLEHIDEDMNVYINLSYFGALMIDKDGEVGHVGLDKKGYSLIKLEEFSFLSFLKDIPLKNQKLNHLLKNSNMLNTVYLGDFQINPNSLRYAIQPIIFSNNEYIILTNNPALKSQTKSIRYIFNEDFYSISYIVKLKNNKFGVGRINSHGLLILENVSSEIGFNVSTLIPDLNVNNLFLRNKNELWISTENNGVIFFDPNLPILKRSSSEVAKSIAISHDKDYYIIDGKKEIIRYLNTEEIHIENNIDSEGDNLIYDKEKDIIWTPNGFVKNNLYHNLIQKGDGKKIQGSKKVFKSYKDDAYWSLSTKSLKRYTEKSLKYDNVVIIENKKSRPFSFIERFDGTILISFNDGVFGLQNNSFVDFSKEDELNIRIEDILETPDSTLIFGSKGNGVIFYKDSVLNIFNTDNGLASNMIEDLHTTNGDTIWVGTLNGLSRIIPKNKNPVRTYTIANGLPSNEIYQIDTYNGVPYLATGKGAIKFIPPSLDTISTEPIITDIYITKEKIKKPSVVLPAITNELQFDYVTLNYKQLGKINYRYRIIEDNDWNYSKNTSVLFTNLSSGNYEFELQSQNQDGFWSKSTFQPFRVKYPWYNTWISWLIYFLIIAGSIFTILELQRRAQVNKQRIKDQIRELEKSALRAQINPHFMFNCLNAIEQLVLQNENDRAVIYMNRFGNLVRQSLDSSVNNLNHFKVEINSIENYLELEQLRYKDKFKYSINIPKPLLESNIFVPSMVIQPFVENSVIHGVANNPKDGIITITGNRTDKYLFIEITDNGPGFIQQSRKSVKSHGRTSLGVSITKKRMDLLSDNNDKKLVKMEEIKNEEGLILGTKITLNFPIEKEGQL